MINLIKRNPTIRIIKNFIDFFTLSVYNLREFMRWEKQMNIVIIIALIAVTIAIIAVKMEIRYTNIEAERQTKILLKIAKSQLTSKEYQNLLEEVQKPFNNNEPPKDS